MVSANRGRIEGGEGVVSRAGRRCLAPRGRHGQLSVVLLEKERDDDDDMLTPERHLPTTPGQPGHSPQRHTAACRPHHHRHGEHSPTACVRHGRV